MLLLPKVRKAVLGTREGGSKRRVEAPKQVIGEDELGTINKSGIRQVLWGGSKYFDLVAQEETQISSDHI